MNTTKRDQLTGMPFFIVCVLIGHVPDILYYMGKTIYLQIVHSLA